MDKKLENGSLLKLGEHTLRTSPRGRRLVFSATLEPRSRESEIWFRYQVDGREGRSEQGRWEGAAPQQRAIAGLLLPPGAKRIVWSAYVRQGRRVMPLDADTAPLDPAFSMTVEQEARPPARRPAPVARSVKGKIEFEHGEPAAGFTVVARRLGFGGTRDELGSATIGADGDYELEYPASVGDDVGLSIRTDDGDVPLTRAGTGVPLPTSLNLLAPSELDPPEPEFTRLTAALAPLLGDDADKKLSAAVENPARRDITLLAEATKWDARAIAMASDAHAEAKTTGIPAAALYGLARAGLPTSPKALGRVRQSDARAALLAAVKAGVIPSDVVDGALEAFNLHSKRERLRLKSGGLHSSVEDFLNVADISGDDRTKFADVLTDESEGDVWERARAASVSEAAISLLALQGKLAFLTLNNAGLAKHLLDRKFVKTTPFELIRAGFYDEAKWVAELRGLAGGDPAALDASIPPAIAGGSLDARIQAYATELARRVSRMDPHAVTLAKIHHDRFEGIAPIARAGVKLLLERAVGLLLDDEDATSHFKLGQTHLSKFIAKHQITLFAGVAPEERTQTEATMRSLTALYSLAPHDDALDALLSRGMKSAAQIARLGPDGLVSLLTSNVGAGKPLDENSAKAIAWRASQVTATIYSIFDKRRQLEQTLSGGGMTRMLDDDERFRIREKLKGELPTLETLFGNVDYCACDECQSVLSPAAYFVDLLGLIDPRNDWSGWTAKFRDTYGVDYPPNARPPFDVLSDRRPDLSQIPLTCANTNVALPYVDLVNEILEQAVAGKALASYDTGDATSEDLVAEPRNLHWDAYVSQPGRVALDQAVFPARLPFDLPLEMVRAFLDAVKLPLRDLRRRLIQDDRLEPSGAGKTDGLVDVWFERLGLGPLDVELLQRTTEWWKLYGYSTEDDALGLAGGGTMAQPSVESLRNAKTLARRLDVSYEELAELLGTRFVDAGADEAAILARLGLDVAGVDRDLPAGQATGENKLRLDRAKLLFSDVKQYRDLEVRQRSVKLRPPATGCDFGKTWLFFEEDPPSPRAGYKRTFIALNAFVRLRSKLNARARDVNRVEWTISDLDRALVALVPNARAFSSTGWPADDTAWPAAMKTGLIHLAHLEEIFDLAAGRVSREEILTLWTDISSHGPTSLYQRMFQSPSVLGVDAVFSDCAGKLFGDNRLLQGQSRAVASHADGLRLTLGVGLDEVELILTAAGFSGRELSIPLLSTLLRYVVLARAVDLPVRKLLALLELGNRLSLPQLTGSAITMLEHDIPWTHTLQFAHEVFEIRSAGLEVDELERVCRRTGLDAPPGQSDPLVAALTEAPAGTLEPEAALHQLVAAQLGIPLPLAEMLARDVLTVSGLPLAEALRAEAQRGAAVLKLRMAVRALQAFSFSKAELHVLSASPTSADLDALTEGSAATVVEAQAAYAGLTAWIGVAAAGRRFQGSGRVVDVLASSRQLIDGVNTPAVREEELGQVLNALLGVPADTCLTAVRALGLISVTATHFNVPRLTTGAGVMWFADALDAFLRLGLPAADVLKLAGARVDRAAAQSTRSALRARHDASAWRGIAKRVFDPLRKKQRDALVAFLLHAADSKGHPYGASLEQLYEYFLLDPGMEPAVLASRIQLAISSVQSFILRVLRGQEHHPEDGNDPGVDPRILDAKRWEWMSRYRSWEVNRKFFIWPENWLASEFRDDKTHLFRELEASLLEGDVDEDLVRAALQKYILGLEQVARLEMLSMYFDPATKIIHVVGRKPNEPGAYFYRTCLFGMWTPWEPLDVGAEGEHLVLTQWRGRMHLIWVSFMEKPARKDETLGELDPVAKQDLDGFKGASKPQVQIHWVDCVRGKWGNRGSTPTFADLPAAFDGCKASTDDERRLFFVHAASVGTIPREDLRLHIANGDKSACFVFYSKLAPPRLESTGKSPPSPPMSVADARATKWVMSEPDAPLKASFITSITRTDGEASGRQADEHVILARGGPFKLLFPSNASISVPGTPQPPAAVGRPSAVHFKGMIHVFYAGAGSSLHDLWSTANGWFWMNVGSDAVPEPDHSDPEAGITDPHAYALKDSSQLCVVTAGRNSVVEYSWSKGDGPAIQTDPIQWQSRTIYQGQPGDLPPGRPSGGLFAPERGAVFRVGAKLLAVRESDAFVHINLNLSGAEGDPVGFATRLGPQGPRARVLYVGEDGHVHMLTSPSDPNGVWKSSAATAGLPAGSLPAGIEVAALLQDDFWRDDLEVLTIVYKGIDGAVHQIQREWLANGFESDWRHQSFVPQRAPKGELVLLDRSFAPATTNSDILRIVYLSLEGHLVELRRNLQTFKWDEHVLQPAPGSPPGLEGPGLSVAVDGRLGAPRLHLIYRTASGGLSHLVGDDTWRAESIKVENPLAEKDAGLINPFFYESLARGQSFFVEPFIIEKTAHDWTEYTITQRDWIPYENPQLKAIIPDRGFIPDVRGVVTGTSRFKTEVLPEGTALRTAKGLITRYGGAHNPGALLERRGAIDVLDLRRPRVTNRGGLR